ncbi:MAG: CRISPR-associated protein Csx11 [Nitrososphaerota archaeon]|nr:CRISPR-associated protein Csx11 [Candidatus Brockarchaeota archaeon]
MSKAAVDILNRSRPLIVFTEILGLLHDVGKLDDEIHRNHYQRTIVELNPDGFIKGDVNKSVLSKKDVPEILSKLFSQTFLKDFLPLDTKLLDIVGNSVLGGAIFNHHNEDEIIKRPLIEQIIFLADKQDSSEDRGAHEEESVPADKTYVATPFGFESSLLQEHFKEKVRTLNSKYRCDVKTLREARRVFYDELSKRLEKIIMQREGKLYFVANFSELKELRDSIYSLAEDFFSLSLAESRRPANDVILFDHCYMTAALAKAIIAGCVIDEAFYRTAKAKIAKDQRFRYKLIVVGFRGREFLTNVNRLPDFVGRRQRFERIRNIVRQIIEFDLPLGNLIYEDLNIMCFLVPDLDSSTDGHVILNEIRKKVTTAIVNESNGILAPVFELVGDETGQASDYIGPLIKNAKDILETKIQVPFTRNPITSPPLPWVELWKKAVRKEKCQICGYAPEVTAARELVFAKGEKICRYCLELRLEGMKERTKAIERKEQETIWLDELRDDRPDNRIALIVGKITPVEEWLNGELIRKTTRTVYANENKSRSKISSLNQIKGLFKNLKDLVNAEKLNDAEKVKAAWKTIEELKSKVEGVLKGNPKALQLFEEEVDARIKRREVISEVDTLIQKMIRILLEKSPSPSRLRRVWRELLDFSERSESLARKFFDNQKLLRRRLVIEVEGKLEPGRLGDTKIGAVICKDNKTLITADHLDAKLNGKKLGEYNEKDLKELFANMRLAVTWSDGSRQELKVKEIKDIQSYAPILPVYKTTGEFMLLCPAKPALSIVNEIKSYFFNRFEKALGKLNLNLGVLYFKYKYPLYIILDAGKRLIKEFELLKRKEREVTIKKVNESFLFNNLGWRITPKLRDGGDDRYYPVLKDANTGDYVSLLDLADGSRVKVHMNHFDFENVDSSQKRFGFAIEGNNQRVHAVLGTDGPRPYLLEDLGEIFHLWTILCKLTRSQIKNLEQTCVTKIEEWFRESSVPRKNPAEDGTYRAFVEASVRNICKDGLIREEKEKLVQAILSGMFFDTVELFITLGSHIPKGG